MKVDTETLAGPLLNWATAQAMSSRLGEPANAAFQNLWISENHHVYLFPFNHPEYRSSLFDPLRNTEQLLKITADFTKINTTREDVSHGGWSAQREGSEEHIEGSTENEAILRCFVHSVLGHTVDVSKVNYINSIGPN